MKTYYPKYLDREVYKRCVSTAGSYDRDKKLIKRIEADAIFRSPTGQGSSDILKPVERAAEQIEKHTRLLRYRTEAVERALARFGEEEQLFLQQNLLSGIAIPYCRVLKSERTCQTVRHEFLIALAEELGEIF